ncbi:MAG TPA: hypothetical protein VFR76_12890, partial [Verrucomicrobiae bacterium]|nr:hypothetical protein [Verrucomicrobiae bacterium]
MFLIFRQTLPQRINTQRARQRNARRVFGADVGALAQRRHRRTHDAFGKAFLINVRQVENFKAIRAVGGVEVFAAQREIENLFGVMVVGFFQHAFVFLGVLLE